MENTGDRKPINREAGRMPSRINVLSRIEKPLSSLSNLLLIVKSIRIRNKISKVK
jgi:hypothetical protein